MQHLLCDLLQLNIIISDVDGFFEVHFYYLKYSSKCNFPVIFMSRELDSFKIAPY